MLTSFGLYDKDRRELWAVTFIGLVPMRIIYFEQIFDVNCVFSHFLCCILSFFF